MPGEPWANSKEEIARHLKITQDLHKPCLNSWKQVMTTFYLAQSIMQNLRLTTVSMFQQQKKDSKNYSIHISCQVRVFFLISRILIQTLSRIRCLKLCKYLLDGEPSQLPHQSLLHQAESEATARYQLHSSFLCRNSFSV